MKISADVYHFPNKMPQDKIVCMQCSSFVAGKQRPSSTLHTKYPFSLPHPLIQLLSLIPPTFPYRLSLMMCDCVDSHALRSVEDDNRRSG
jgi:hypothetical protein